MPSAYTEPLYKGEPFTFAQFVWRCTRSFGALMDLRDEPLNAPIPEKLEPSNYHFDKLAEARGRLLGLQGLTASQLDTAAEESYSEAVTERRKWEADKSAMVLRYERMLRQVEGWQPPTADHENLKRFMVNQLHESLQFDCGPLSLPEPIRLTGPEWYAAQLAQVKRDIEYYQKRYEEEVARTAEKNQWLNALRESVPIPIKEPAQ